MPILLTLWACNGESEPCIEPDLALWCSHDEDMPGPAAADDEEAGCETPLHLGSAKCGGFKVIRDDQRNSGVDHYFRDGEHVATQYWSSDPIYCEGYSYWYGEEITCF